MVCVCLKCFELCVFHFVFSISFNCGILIGCRPTNLFVTTTTVLVGKDGILFVFVE